jgi:hypothetical protein
VVTVCGTDVLVRVTGRGQGRGRGQYTVSCRISLLRTPGPTLSYAAAWTMSSYRSWTMSWICAGRYAVSSMLQDAHAGSQSQFTVSLRLKLPTLNGIVINLINWRHDACAALAVRPFSKILCVQALMKLSRLCKSSLAALRSRHKLCNTGPLRIICFI